MSSTGNSTTGILVASLTTIAYYRRVREHHLIHILSSQYVRGLHPRPVHYLLFQLIELPRVETSPCQITQTTFQVYRYRPLIVKMVPYMENMWAKTLLYPIQALNRIASGDPLNLSSLPFHQLLFPLSDEIPLDVYMTFFHF